MHLLTHSVFFSYTYTDAHQYINTVKYIECQLFGFLRLSAKDSFRENK